MFVGHFAAGLIAKRAAPAVSLGTTILAALFADLLFCVFLLLGIEQVAIQPGITAVNPLDLVSIPFSHSLLMDVVWASALAAIYFWRRRDRHGAWVIFAAVLSHWLLDWVSHRPDMPLAPGVAPRFGLGLWHSVWATFVVEGLLWSASLAAYLRITKAKNRKGVFGFWAMIVVLSALWVLSLGGTPPPSVLAIGVVNSGLIALVLFWAYRVDLHRPVQKPIGRARAGEV
jgi:hypothetical protein